MKFQVSFSPFMLNITSFFLERICIIVVPWRNTFFFNLFKFDGATVSNVLEKIVPMLLVILSSSSVVMGI